VFEIPVGAIEELVVEKPLLFVGAPAVEQAVIRPN
jgi:hypothetical protein